MSEILLFSGFGADPVPQPKSRAQQRKTVAKRVETAVVRKVEIKPEEHLTRSLTNGERCRICGEPISIPGLDASLCSNAARSCGASGWVVAPQWPASQSQKGGGKANG